MRGSWVHLNFARERREQDALGTKYVRPCHAVSISTPRRPCPHSQGRLLSPSFLELMPQAADCAPQTSPGSTHPSSYPHALMFHVPCNYHLVGQHRPLPLASRGLPNKEAFLGPLLSSALSSYLPQICLTPRQFPTTPVSCRGVSPMRVEESRGQGGQGLVQVSGSGPTGLGVSREGRSCLAAPVPS